MMRVGSLGLGVGRTRGRTRIVSAASVALNPSDMDPALALSNGNLTVTNTDTLDTGAENVRATRGVSRSGGKFYFECMFEVVSAQASYTGLASPSHSLSSSLGQSTVSYGVNSLGDCYYNAISTSPGTPNLSLPIRVAYDGTTGNIWVGYTTTTPALIWCGGGDPATGATPTWTYAGSEVLFPAITLRNNNDRATVNFGATAFVYAVPAGFSAWNNA